MFGNAKYGGAKSISQILNMIICARLIPNLELESPMISVGPVFRSQTSALIIYGQS